MSEAKVKMVLGGYEAFNRGDFDAATEGFDAEIEWVPLAILPEENRPVHGPQGVREWWAMWQEVFGDFRIEVDEVIDAGDQVIVMAVILGKGEGSGATVSTPRFAHVWTLRDGRAVRMEMFTSKDQALEAAGVSE